MPLPDIDETPESVKSRLGRFMYNLDRAAASLLGAQPQETLSSQFGRHSTTWWGRFNCWWLDKLDPGHCANAVKHADKLKAADDGFNG